MKINEVLNESKNDAFIRKYIPWIQKELGIASLPKIVLQDSLDDTTFGKYVPEKKILFLATANRHPVDVLRTMAHELTHYRQDLNGQTKPDSGETGSPEENEANSVAGIVMRHFNQEHPEFLKMKMNEDAEPMPHLYLDMDGVQADFFGAWADHERVPHYKHIPDAEVSITKMGRDPAFVKQFFATLKPLKGGMRIIQWLHQHRVPFTVLSAPLRGQEEASIHGKREWLDQYVPGTSQSAIFTGEKFKFAKTNGQPNVLVDDFGKYINAWREHGGIAIKHDDTHTDATIRALEQIYLPKAK